MKMHFEWARPIPLKDGTRENLIYTVDPYRLPVAAGVYIFGRRWGSDFEALYVGKAGNIRGRVKGQMNNLRLMQHLRNAKTGKRVVLVARVLRKPGQRAEKCMTLAERTLIRHFMSEGHDLVNKQGTQLQRHELVSTGNHPKKFFPRLMYLEKTKGG